MILSIITNTIHCIDTVLFIVLQVEPNPVYEVIIDTKKCNLKKKKNDLFKDLTPSFDNLYKRYF